MENSELDEYGAHAAKMLASVDQSSIPADVSFTLEQQVGDSASLVGHYHLRIHDGHVAVAAGPADAPDVVICQDATTAMALRNGTLHAQGAFLTGRLSIDGDINSLLEYGPLLTKLLNSVSAE